VANEGHEHWIIDQSSTNKTYIGEAMTPLKPERAYELRHNRILTFANTRTRYEILSELNKPPLIEQQVC